ncbi:MAG TPA: neocarzinostatin apoprotein domain-containing protein [Acidimicrobiales bacterium]
MAALTLGIVGPVPGASPAGAAIVLDVTAEPSTGLRAGDQVVLTVSNLDAANVIAAGQCDVAVLDSPDPFGATLSQCTFDLLNIPADGRVTRTVVETISRPGLAEPVHCGDAPGDCVMYVSTDQGSVGFAPIDVVPSPLAVAPESVTTRQSFHTWESGEPGAELTVAQCAAPVATSLAAADCAVTVPVTLDGSGLGAVELQPVLTIPTAGGTADCRSGGCALASFDAAGAQVASVPVTVTQPTITLDPFPTPSENLTDGQTITVDVYADTREPVLVGQCAASIATTGDLAGGPCRDVRELTVPPDPTGSLGKLTISYQVQRSFVGADGATVDCAPFNACVMAMDTVATDDVSLATRPIQFVQPPPVVTTSRTRGLLEGQPITIDITGLRPDASFILAVCDKFPDTLNVLFGNCAPPTPTSPITVAADHAGHLSYTAPAVLRFDAIAPSTPHPVYCRDQCRIALYAPGASVEVPYTLATGHLSVTPSQRLTDGQAVTLTGRRIMTSYAGPVVDGVPSGRWTAYECAHAVDRDPSPAGVARNCVAVPGTVTVPASGDVTVSMTVQATIQPPQGPAVDCTRSSNACRAVLHRVEQDGTISLHEAPLHFARR